ncbi:MAG: hydroxymethylbilane synthase [Candidatus Eiseniibacteriota bacterium]
MPASTPATPSVPRLRLGTRGSALALAQAAEVRARLAAVHPALAEPAAVETMAIRTTGDAVTDRPLADVGGKGLFTKEIDAALLGGRIDLAVHSMKDMESHLAPGTVIAAVLPREDPRDALVGAGVHRIADLKRGARVGTSSVRRTAQLLALRPDLEIVPFRGNVNTRLAKLDAGAADAIVLALAGLHRLGLARADIAVLEPSEMLPSAAQGAIAVACRADDTETRALLAALDDRASHVCVMAERALLATLDGSCRTPIAALARLDGDRLVLDALVASHDGRDLYRARREGAAGEGDAMGRDAGAELRQRAPAALFADAG